MSTICFICKSDIDLRDYHYADGQYLCESCFDKNYEYCRDCGNVFHRNDLMSNHENIFFCLECYTKNNDEMFPDNPPVNNSERDKILKLCNCRAKCLKNIQIEKNSLFREIRCNVGLTDKDIFLYNAEDDPTYDLEATNDIAIPIEKFFSKGQQFFRIKQIEGTGKIGITSRMKSNKYLVINLLKEVI